MNKVYAKDYNKCLAHFLHNTWDEIDKNDPETLRKETANLRSLIVSSVKGQHKRTSDKGRELAQKYAQKKEKVRQQQAKKAEKAAEVVFVRPQAPPPT